MAYLYAFFESCFFLDLFPPANRFISSLTYLFLARDLTRVLLCEISGPSIACLAFLNTALRYLLRIKAFFSVLFLLSISSLTLNALSNCIVRFLPWMIILNILLIDPAGLHEGENKILKSDCSLSGLLPQAIDTGTIEISSSTCKIASRL